MKITELKCTACHGTLKVDENNPKIAVCEYCQTKHVLEYESSGEVHFELPSHREPSYIEITESRPSIGRYVAGTLLLILISCFIIGSAVLKGITNSTASAQKNQKLPTTEALANIEEKSKTKLTGVLALMAEEVTGKPVESLTEEDLAQFSWIEVKGTIDVIKVGYSFDNPYEIEDASLTWLEYSKDSTSVDMGSFASFRELKYLESSGSLSGVDLTGLKLQGIGCNAKTPAELISRLDSIDELKEVKILGSLKSLDGIEQLKGIEKLYISGSDVSDISSLAGLKDLKSLSIIGCKSVEDFSVLHVMTWLKELSIKSEAVKDIGFIDKMPELEHFSLSRAKLLNLDSLAEKHSLISLEIDDCNEMTDCSAISTLTGLKQLSLKLPNKCAQPNLGTLTQLEILSVSGMDTINFLESMPNLAELDLSRCKINQTSAFTQLVNLKKLTCRSLSGNDVEWGFAAKIPSLEVLDLTGVATYKDVSVLFNIPTLKELYLNGIECELNFAVLQPNESLEILHMDGVKLYKNVRISGGGGITYVDYDRVTLDENTAFLLNYPNLRILSLAENKLSNIGFAENLAYLETININENYVTDLKPLESLTILQKVACKGNPVENYRVLNDDIQIVK